MNRCVPFIGVSLFVFFAASFLTSSAIYANDSLIVEKHGQLRTSGNRIVDKNDRSVALHGMSLFWSQWGEGSKYYNNDCVQWLIDDWKCTVVRAAMGIEMGGYLSNPLTEKTKMKTVIEACIDLGIYVIVDWHDHHAQWHTAESIAFFEEIAAEYGSMPNLIYEIYNEPLQVSWKDTVKPYADTVIAHIRAIDPDNLILVGSPTWSQDVDIASADPLPYENIAYSLHFYAATHKQSLRNKAITALNRGVSLFVSEFGTCEYNGSGVIDSAETNTWMQFMDANRISWCNWSIADKAESSAALKKGAEATGGWPDSVISISGLLIRRKLREIYEAPANHVIETAGIITDYKLMQNYPNPFNPKTVISYKLTVNSKVVLKIYDQLGREIAVLVDGIKSSGEHTVEWDAQNLPSGVYYYRIRAGKFHETKKMLLLK